MATSRTPGPQGRFEFDFTGLDQLPGVLGQLGRWLHRDSPGTLGVHDAAARAAKAHLPPPVVHTGKCACNRDLTLDELCAIYKAQKRAKCESFLEPINATCKTYGINTCLRKAHFLAQIGHESGELKYVSEILPKGKKEADVYDGYKGRGLMQVTWKKGYEAYGKSVGHDFLGDHKVELEEPKWATDSAGNYWQNHNNGDLNKAADKNDLLAVTCGVNGAFNGFSDRASLLKVGLSVLKVRECDTVKIGTEDYVAFDKSSIYDNYVFCFAWGAWNDPKSGKKGVSPMSADARKAGYARYLEFREKQLKLPLAQQPKKSHYKLTMDEMDDLANEGVK